MAANEPAAKVDAIFHEYANAKSPGCSVGVIRDGKIVFQKAYGEASLELRVPLSTDSVFYLASVSKQFTAASVVLAAKLGFLSLDDDVRKYVPELPDYGHTITLRQMLHQTSGLRDFLSITYLAGRDMGALSSNDEVLRIITRQKGLNNVPGDEFVYSNSNYFLSGLVIQRATGKSLAEFARERIFGPLGMQHTLYYDDNSKVVPNRVAAYEAAGGGNFSVDWSTLFDIVGSGGLMSDVGDLALWDNNFYSGRVGGHALAADLQTPGKLNDGKTVNYGLGLWLSSYRGVKTVEHSGGTFGYRSELLRFPEQHFSAVELCNIGNADVEGMARKIADIYLDKDLRPEQPMVWTGNFVSGAKFAGTYLDPRTHVIYTFTARDGRLSGWGATLKRLGPNRFSDLVGNPIDFDETEGGMRAKLTIEGEVYFSGSRVPEIHLSESELGGFAGAYRSDELDAVYRFSASLGKLTVTYGNGRKVTLKPVARNEFEAGDLGSVVFDPAAATMTLFSQAARGIVFQKMN